MRSKKLRTFHHGCCGLLNFPYFFLFCTDFKLFLAMSEQETPLGLTKWQLGLLIGVPVAVVTVAGVVWYLNSSDANEELQEEEGAAKTPEKETPKPQEDKDEVENMVSLEKSKDKSKSRLYFLFTTMQSMQYAKLLTYYVVSTRDSRSLTFIIEHCYYLQSCLELYYILFYKRSISYNKNMLLLLK